MLVEPLGNVTQHQCQPIRDDAAAFLTIPGSILHDLRDGVEYRVSVPVLSHHASKNLSSATSKQRPSAQSAGAWNAEFSRHVAIPEMTLVSVDESLIMTHEDARFRVGFAHHVLGPAMGEELLSEAPIARDRPEGFVWLRIELRKPQHRDIGSLMTRQVPDLEESARRVTQRHADLIGIQDTQAMAGGDHVVHPSQREACAQEPWVCFVRQVPQLPDRPQWIQG